MKICNFTLHTPTPDMIAAGVEDPIPEETRQRLLVFTAPPSPDEMRQRAEVISSIILNAGYSTALIGGAPFFMGTLENTLYSHLITPLYAFSKRDEVDVPQPDGSVKKTQVFKFKGFVRTFN